MSRGTWSICLWEPSLSPHKLDLVRALKAHSAVETCTYVCEEGELSDARKQLGWEVDPSGLSALHVRPTPEEIARIVRDAPANTVHLFSGIHWVPTIVGGLRQVVLDGARFGIMAEPRASEGAAGMARLVHSWLSEGPVRRNADFVLAIGRNGPPWFRRAGYARRRIFPFAYFLPVPAPAAPDPPRRDACTVSYLGRLTEEKGILLFLDAMNTLPRSFEIDVAGAGHLDVHVREAAAASGGRIRFRGAIAMSDVPHFLSGTDILVVPSLTTDDGWGAVVSEGLMAGAAVVATAKVGASICLDDPSRGMVLSDISPEALGSAVGSLAQRRSPDGTDRQHRRSWATSRLSGEAGAAYLVDILRHVFEDGPRPSPFYEDSPLASGCSA